MGCIWNECKRKGGKTVWEACPVPITEVSIDAKLSSMQQILVNMNEKMDEKLKKIMNILQGNIFK